MTAAAKTSRPHKARHLVIRRARPSDAQMLVQLVHQLNARQGESTEHFTLKAAKRDVFGTKPQVQILIAELEREVVGYAFLSPSYESGWAARGLFVNDIHITDAAREKGVGRAIMAACAAYARRQGKTYLWWASKAWNVDEQDFYRKLGAVEEPIMAHALPFARFDKLADEGENLLDVKVSRRKPKRAKK